MERVLEQIGLRISCRSMSTGHKQKQTDATDYDSEIRAVAYWNAIIPMSLGLVLFGGIKTSQYHFT